MVAQARIPLVNRFNGAGSTPGMLIVAALQAAALILTPAAAPVPKTALETSLTVMDVGTPGVRVLLIKSLRADKETSPFGVIRRWSQTSF